MKNKLKVVDINEYLEKLVKHLLLNKKDDPYNIIIDSLLGLSNMSLYKSKEGMYSIPMLTGEVKYERQIETLKKKGIIITIGQYRMVIDPRFHSILKTRKYQWVKLLSKRQRNDAENQLKKKRVNRDIIKAVLDNLDENISLIRLWKDIKPRPLDHSLPNGYRSFCRIVRKHQRELVLSQEPDTKKTKNTKYPPLPRRYLKG